MRRELRALQGARRPRALLAAAEVLYSVNTSDGQRRYGARYHDIHHFVRMHMYWSGNADCDHWHEGPGFTTSHVGLLAHERALQAVDPSVSLPYWDYTVDSSGTPRVARPLARLRRRLLGAASVDGAGDLDVARGRRGPRAGGGRT